MKQAAVESRKEPEKKAPSRLPGAEQKTSLLSQAHLLAGAVKRRRYADASYFNPDLCPCNSIRSLINYPVDREHSLEVHRDVLYECQKLLQCKDKKKKFYK